MKHPVVVNIVSTKDEKVLIVEKDGVWIFPGGKLEPGEDVAMCIERELSEELPGSRLEGSVIYFEEFCGKSPKGKDIKVICCLGDVCGDITPAAEISAAKWASREEILELVSENSLSDVTQAILKKLKLLRGR